MNDFDPVGEWMAAFGVELTPAMVGEIEANVKAEDAEAWRATIKKYELNYHPAYPRDYNPRKIANVMGVFREIKEGQGYATYRPISGLSVREMREFGAFKEERDDAR